VITKQTAPDAHRINPEALRGAVALFVVFHHFIFFKQYLDPNYFPQSIAKFEPPGHFCVLIFFVLSGYVIGASNPNRLTSDKIMPYLKKRFIRLYPIYFIALTFTLLVASNHYPLHTILTDYTILQNTLGDVILENKPIWSLNYEVIYYLLFIPLSYFRVKPLWVVLGSVVIGLLNYALYPAFNVPVISAYAYGFAFWATGWCISVYFKQKENGFSYSKLFAGLFLVLSHALLSVQYYVADKLLFSKIHTDFSFPEAVNGFRRMVSFGDLFDLPYCILLLVMFAGINFKGKKYFIMVLQFLPLLAIAQMITHLHLADNLGTKVLSVMCYTLFILLYYAPGNFFEGISKKVITVCIKLGTISYGLYIFHFPILVAFGKASFLSGTALTYALRFASYLILCLAVAWATEKKFQVWIAAKLKKWLMPETPRPRHKLLVKQLRWLKAQV
jgi:peptidoglycan/LPS O-acetylase OafA/YrhL